MSIEKIYPEDIEVFTLETFPRQTYHSSSLSGPTGSANVYAFRSRIQKDYHPKVTGSANPYAVIDNSVVDVLKTARYKAVTSGSNTGELNQYFTMASSLPESQRKQQKVEVYRFNPGIDINYTHLQKMAVINSLFEYHRPTKPCYQYGFTNYNTLNFYTASSVPSDSVLLYPHDVTSGANNTLTGSYFVSSAFTFDFWINPRYTTDLTGSAAVFHAGCLLHLSSCYAVSLVTGSSRDVYGKPDKYRVLLQLSGGATISPSKVNLTTPQDLCFVSDDNSLNRNTWHHVSIRWGAGDYNNGSGSFLVNGESAGSFVVPSSSVIPLSFLPGKDNPTVLCVGNFYEGTNTGTSVQAYFFTDTVATQDGVKELVNTTAGTEEPVAYTFQHPLNAEVHDVKIYGRYLNDVEIEAVGSASPESDAAGLKFFLPPFFAEEAPTRSYTYGRGGVLITPFQTKDSTTTQPFSTELSYELGAHYINLENFTRNFVATDSGAFPRLLNLTASVITVPVVIPQTADAILYATKSVVKRAITVLPNDNGAFYPRFSTWLGNLASSSFKTDLGTKDESIVTLRNLYSTASIYTGFLSDSQGSLLRGLLGPDPSTPSTFGDSVGHVPTIIQRTRDNTSNQVVFFDVSNLYYGNRIHPSSVELTDSYISGSDNKLGVTLKDDGFGNLYRFNPSGSSPTWNSVGNVFYDEGIILIKHPSLYFFGQNQFTLTLKGETSIHTLKIGCTLRPLLQTSSSNPSYIPVDANDLAHDTDKQFVYITDILIHDDNLNVIGRGKLAQPHQKKTGDKTKMYWRMDF